MLVTTSQHTEPLRKKESGPRRWIGVSPAESALNVPYLTSIIDNTDDDKSISSGRKRPASPSTSSDFAKRLKQSTPKLVNHERVPVIHHTFNVQYTSEDPSTTDDSCDQDENLSRFLQSLKQFTSNTESQVLHLGDFTKFDILEDRVFIECMHKVYGRDWLLLIPPLFDDIGDDAHDLDIRTKDLMVASQILCRHNRVCIECSLKLILPPSGFVNSASELPFHIQIEMNISLEVPQIFSNEYRHGLKKVANEIEDAQRRLLSYVFPATVRSPSELAIKVDIPFFYSTLKPAPKLLSTAAENAMQPSGLVPSLLPFQKRSVGWLLGREGKRVDEIGNILTKPAAEQRLAMFWEKIEREEPWYFNRLTGELSDDMPLEGDVPPGGILAEEPGLGKTLECISLILLNPAGPGRNPSVQRWDCEAKIQVKEIKTTLIVTPSSLASQWASELALHAPSLKVFIYDGWAKTNVPIPGRAQVKKDKKANPRSNGEANARRERRGPANVPDDNDSHSGDDSGNWCTYINTFDVCITTYSVLQQEFNVARAPPERPRREDVKYSNLERPRSPLIMCEWYRVIMDEVQMVGGGNTERMVSLIPRVSSWAVSGTPAKVQVADLMHLLKFLRVDNIIGSARLWSRIQYSGFFPQFAEFFGRFGIRAMKSALKNELTIPQQTRYLVNIKLGPVERHVYDQNLQDALNQLGFDARGVVVTEGWEPDPTLLRSWIRKLRGICTHPQVGQLQKLGDKLSKPGALKTMAQVLESMKEQNWRNLMDDRKSKVQLMVRYAQLQQRHETDLQHCEHALRTLKDAEKAATDLIQELKATLADHRDKGDQLKKQTLREENNEIDNNHNALTGKVKGKAAERHVSTPISDVPEIEEDDLQHTPAGEERSTKKGALQSRLRECHIILHQIWFLQGDIHHAMGSPAEDEAYEQAEKLRQSLLKSSSESASRAMQQLGDTTNAKCFPGKDLFVKLPYLSGGGIRSHMLFDEANDIIELLNEQTTLLLEWRLKLYNLLTQKLSPDQKEADGEEYARTLEVQGEAETYLQAYSALAADRREVLIAERTLLAAHDARERKLRRTKAAIKASLALELISKKNPQAEEAGGTDTKKLEFEEGVELTPEQEVLKGELAVKRKTLLERFQGRAVKSVMVDLSNVQAKIAKDSDPEKIIAKDGAARIRELITSQNTLMDKVDADFALFRKAFNERILYFRHLQEISDSVVEVAWDGSIATALEECAAERTDVDSKVNTGRARLRYLNHLCIKENMGTDDDDQSCILCKCAFIRGFITQCAHVFCEVCMKLLLARKERKYCPVCRKDLSGDVMQRFIFDGETALHPPKPTVANVEPMPRSRRDSSYNFIDPDLLQNIQNMEIHGSYGSKIETLVRHLLYLKMSQPGAKSIVFSAWADSLYIVEHALIMNDISFLRIDQGSRKQSATEKFKNNPDILVLLLHGERENAGLNVTCASRVFLMESVVHQGFEAQAIARIDRMGQTNTTEVYCYYGEDTVERSILDLAARRGLSLYTRDHAREAIDMVSFANQSRKNRAEKAPAKRKMNKGDFIFKTEDMLAVLFPHMFEEIEYLVPEKETPLMEVDTNHTTAASSSRSHPPRFLNTNAIAGSSRLG